MMFSQTATTQRYKHLPCRSLENTLNGGPVFRKITVFDSEFYTLPIEN